MNTNAAAAGRQIILRIAIDEELHDIFAADAMMRGVEVEELIAQHLWRTREWTGEHPLYLDDAAADKMRRLLGGAINSAEKLIAKIREIMTIRFSPAEIVEHDKQALPEVALTPAQIQQIGSYAKTAGKSFDEMFTIIVRDAIAEKLRA